MSATETSGESPYPASFIQAARFVLGYRGHRGGNTPTPAFSELMERWDNSTPERAADLTRQFPLAGYAMLVIEEDGLDGLADLFEPQAA